MAELLQKLQADQPAIAAVLIVSLLGLLEFLFGILDAVRNNQFGLPYLDVWVRTQLLGKIVPIILILSFSYVVGSVNIGGFQLNLLFLAGQTAAVAYGLTTIDSIIKSVRPDVPDSPPAE
jgi:hypothetical protein